MVKGGTVTTLCVQTPLHLSARHYSERYLPITLMLIECGANVTLEDRDGKTPGQVRLHASVLSVTSVACVLLVKLVMRSDDWS